MKKRGQITLFIIIGIVIIVSIGFIIGIRNFRTGGIDKLAPIIEEVKSEILPVKTFTDDCLSLSLRNGLELLGEQGGYIYLEGKYDFSDPTNSEGVVWQKNGLKTAYWSFNNKKNSESYKNILIIPSIEYMERELENYVLTETRKCLDNYNELKEIGFEIEEGKNYELSINIAENSVDALLIHKVEVNRENVEDDVSNFFASHNVNLNEMHEIASYLSTYQAQNKYLEEFFLNIYSMYEGKSTRLPPMRDVGTSLIAKDFWVKELLKKDLDDLVFTHIPLLQIRNSADEFIPLSRDENYNDVKNAIIDYWSIRMNASGISDKELQKYRIQHNYLPSWNTYFDVNDENGIIKPKSTCVSFVIGSTCVNRYDTIMDYSFPVVVSINEKEAFDNEGFKFNFALEGNLRNNLPPSGEVDVMQKTITLLPSLMCEAEGFEKEINIKVIDRFTHTPIEGASVFYGNEIRSCPIGVTNENGIIKAQVPNAFGGVLSAEADNYVLENIYLDTYLMGNEDLAQIELWQKKDIPVEIKINYVYNCKKIDDKYTCYRDNSTFQGINLIEEYNSPGSSRGRDKAWEFKRTNLDLGYDDRVVLSMERAQYDELPSGDIPSALVADSTTENIMTLIPGKYKINAKLLADIDLNISKEKRKIDPEFDVLDPTTYDPLLREATSDMREFEMPEFVMDSEMVYGGYVGEVKILPGELYGSEKIVLNIIKFGHEFIPEDARIIEDLNIVGSIENISNDHNSLGISFSIE